MKNIFRGNALTGGGGAFGRGRRELYQQQSEFAKTNYGYISGVLFDFTHEELPPGKWDISGPVSEKMEGHDGFYIPKTDPKSLQAAIEEIGGSAPLDNFDAFIARRLKEDEARAVKEGMFILRPGDAVKVARADICDQENAELFANEADRYRAWVDFAIHRADGAVEDGGSALFFHSGCMAHGMAEGRARRQLLRRLSFVTKGAPGGEALAEVVDLAGRLYDRLEALREALWEQQEKLEGEDLLKGLHALSGPTYDLDEVVDLAVLYGYRQGYLEASLSMRPMAEAGFERRRVELLRGWEKRDRTKEEFAAQYWKDNPEAKFYDVLVQYNARPGAGSPILATQFNEAVGHVCPPSSSSYQKPAAVKAREKMWERHAFGIY